MTNPKSVRAAAIQVEARVADIPWNIEHASRLVDAAVQQGAELVALPEFFTTCIIYDERVFGCSLPPDNPALDMLKDKARRHRIHIGGSYLEMRDGDVYNTYVFVEPDGTVHRHDKDLPTMVENAFYVGGRDAGLMQTTLGPVGAAVCWETVRTQTVKRLRGKVGLLMTGSHWWSEPGWKWPRDYWRRFHEGNGRMMARTPGIFAGLVGAPLLHAGHAGVIEGGLLVLPGSRLAAPMRTQLMGETQIIDGEGNLLQRRRYQEGAGVVTADIVLGPSAPRAETPPRFWIPKFNAMLYAQWYHQNAAGKSAYRWAKRTGRLRTWDGARNAQTPDEAL
ncbi:MAG: carbon-nitrogen hydrolase family protein [Parvibaculum sp.]|uniref:carbon-nitrogen hydrolase family protein n=1 Tax=Parvibaculum sp. TaxID=2024848 RepID=UPI002732213C|nr:carbon-nitrogen hydrolase family protein [Parvibaculum sp.]MDP1628464.1 carbon-nitrogen hydrolase family protein [Parvibaculum sp.]